MMKILKDSELDRNSIKSYDFKTQTLINIAKNFKEQRDFRVLRFRKKYNQKC